MSYTTFDTYTTYDDPILTLARDPNLLKEKAKNSKINSIIQGLAVTERKVSRLCQLSLTILQTLEKIDLNLKNWTFFSLDASSADHFDASNTEENKEFNNNVSLQVINSCQELTKKLNKISADVDFITNASKSLSPLEFISDSGTLLTSLTLRNIKLKDELRDKVTIAYSKAKLITIGTDLELMLGEGSSEQQQTVYSYKQFVMSLLKQLNDAVDGDDIEERNECLAVISDMEQMFEAFKLEKVQQAKEELAKRAEQAEYTPQTSKSGQDDDHRRYSPETDYSSRRRDSLSSSSTTVMQQSLLSEELPYLMSAFRSDEKQEGESEYSLERSEVLQQKAKKQHESHQEPQSQSASILHFPHQKTQLPETSLYTGGEFVTAPPAPSPYSYLNTGSSWLSKLGIKPQVITADKHLVNSTTVNRGFAEKQLPSPSSSTSFIKDKDHEDKENANHTPLSIENLEAHTLSSLSHDDDHLLDYVE
ncbi:hypothetical protein FT663_04899 [Candidozyma haemuli var. vulneris]|uniref:Uncharacterized protein n=1 Tax=Candidozyma haemuli TaxID=45357 RepID=A0A2V1ARN4_9ASCO|nr:hypothetical protein CXQ85_001700 [[Candida] haemuloni]KAF3986415.1 hypothetical protein FT663_04899 [[Candida] haemuloni var. vulneris]KAF3987935.1 hypothetical protein FT662_03706 [[Candida] haemuloni var. vulneris]PVH19923.1 hypothetical protein CXQ85_001700 [[Candida] haemuloni]